MPVIRQLPSDPTDIVIQGEQIIPPDSSLTQWFILAGEITFSTLKSKPIPEAMIGQSDWYGIKPRTIGPMSFGQAGMIDMLNIGIPEVNSPKIDPIQKWLNNPLEPVITVPSKEVFRSGLIKRITAPTISPTVGQHLMEFYTETTQKWLLSGTTYDSLNARLPGCRVVIMVSSKIKYNPDILSNPVIAETVSDANGDYSIQVTNPGPYQIIAYKAGGTDVAGVTVDTVIPVIG
jgi:hypothetical protein